MTIKSGSHFGSRFYFSPPKPTNGYRYRFCAAINSVCPNPIRSLKRLT